MLPGGRCSHPRARRHGGQSAFLEWIPPVDAGAAINSELTRALVEGAAVLGRSVVRSGEITTTEGVINVTGASLCGPRQKEQGRCIPALRRWRSRGRISAGHGGPAETYRPAERSGG